MTFLLQTNSWSKFRFHLCKGLKYFQVAIKIPMKDVGILFLGSLQNLFFSKYSYPLSQSFCYLTGNWVTISILDHTFRNYPLSCRWRKRSWKLSYTFMYSSSHLNHFEKEVKVFWGWMFINEFWLFALAKNYSLKWYGLRKLWSREDSTSFHGQLHFID